MANANDEFEKTLQISSEEDENGNTPPPDIITLTNFLSNNDHDDDVKIESYVSKMKLNNECNDSQSDSCYENSEIETSEPERSLKHFNKDIYFRICELVEYYLSDEHLINDVFLLKHVTKHKEGYVSLKLLANYKKIKKMKKDWTTLSEALKYSTKLNLNSEKTKIKRKDPIPYTLDEENRNCRSLLAYDIPEPLLNMSEIAEIFSRFGEVVQIKIHKPQGKSFPQIALLESQYPDITMINCCLITYDKVLCAKQALKLLNDDNSVPFIVIDLPKRTTAKSKLASRFIVGDYESAYSSASELEENPFYRYGYSSNRPGLRENHKPGFHSPLTTQRVGKNKYDPRRLPIDRGHSALAFIRPDMPKARRDYESLVSTPRLRQFFRDDFRSPPSSPVLAYRQLNRKIISAPNSPRVINKLVPKDDYESPQPRRKFFHQSTEVDFSVISPRDWPDNVRRLPRGPDGTRGFRMIRSMNNIAEVC